MPRMLEPFSVLPFTASAVVGKMQKIKIKIYIYIKTLTASTNPQLATGPQKCVVLGPVGELMNCMRRDDDAIYLLWF